MPVHPHHFPHLFLYSPPSQFHPTIPEVCWRLAMLVCTELWLRDEEKFSRLVKLITFGVMEVVTPHDTNLLIEYSTGPVNSQIYLYVLSE
jgi:hypothetical protein